MQYAISIVSILVALLKKYMTKNCGVLIVEDELLIAEHILRTLKVAGYLDISVATTVEEAITTIHLLKPHIVLTDIMLGTKKTGIDLGELLHSQYKIPFIYITSHSSSDMLAKAKHTHPNAYLVKPFKKEDLIVAIEFALFNAELTAKTAFEKSLIIKDGHAIAQIPFDTILYLEAEGNYTSLYISNGKKRLVRTAISELYNQLPTNNFIRIHRSFVINKNCVSEYETKYVYINETKLPVGRMYKDQLDTLFK
jgi:two-component system, LytTR family, response regulator LytT